MRSRTAVAALIALVPVVALADPFATLDLTAGVPLTGSLTLQLRAENVTNTLVEATVASDGTIERAAPRTLWVGLRFGG